MVTEPFQDDPRNSLKDYGAFMRVLRQEILDALSSRNDPEQDKVREALRAEKLKTAFAEHNRECLQNIGRMIDERIDVFRKIDLKELRSDVEGLINQFEGFVESFQDQLDDTLSKENGDKTTGKIMGVKDQVSALVKRIDSFETDIIRRIDGYSEKGHMVVGIMGHIKGLTQRLSAYDKKEQSYRDSWRYSVDILLKLLPILISAAALALALLRT